MNEVFTNLDHGSKQVEVRVLAFTAFQIDDAQPARAVDGRVACRYLLQPDFHSPLVIMSTFIAHQPEQSFSQCRLGWIKWD